MDDMRGLGPAFFMGGLAWIVGWAGLLGFGWHGTLALVFRVAGLFPADVEPPVGSVAEAECAARNAAMDTEADPPIFQPPGGAACRAGRAGRPRGVYGRFLSSLPALTA